MASSEAADTPVIASPERFDPADDSGQLIHSEHVLRYSWAAQAAAGAAVLDAGCGTGYGTALLAKAGPSRLAAVDDDAACVEHLRAEMPDVDAHVADAAALPFEDDAFDLVVCFEVIEHIERREQAMREFARVLRDGGTLLISSPNRNTYPPGNEFHVHEYTPDELDEELSKHFATVRRYRQDAWLGSTLRATGDTPAEMPMRTLGEGPAEELFTVAAASNGTPPELAPAALLGDPFQVKWWAEQLSNLRADAAAAGAAIADAQTRAGELRRLASTAVVDAEHAQGRLATIGARLIDVEQQNALLLEEVEDQKARVERERERVEQAEAVIHALQSSPSWRLTAPLRRLKHLLKG